MRGRPATPGIDLETVSETLGYIRDDLMRVPGLQSAAAALATALKEIDRFDRHTAPQARGIDVIRSRFLARKP